ncbi:MAG: bifunctional serine/threonine-protein kinase/formylglycine-generating enzyme family protein [Candidatus Paceibacterota bacterium]
MNQQFTEGVPAFELARLQTNYAQTSCGRAKRDRLKYLNNSLRSEVIVPRVACPSCAKAYEVTEQSLGGRAQCKSCGETFTLIVARDETYSRPMADGWPSSEAPGQSDIGLVPGNQLAQYILKSKLGAGGMGEVWRARDPHLERDVALKVLPVAIAHDDQRRERFAREARLAARLHHPNAVIVYQFGVQEQQVFIAMELVDGQSLDKVIRENGPLDWRAATNVVCDAARGLAAAHEIGLVHRDIKPGNLMRTTKGETKVVDFGLAREQMADTQFTQQGMLLGTPAYMAPEQWTNEKVDGRSDLYSLICTYYYLVTGALPFEATNFAALGYQHRYEPLPDPRQLRPDLPDRVVRILSRGGEKERGERYQTAAALIADLEVLLEAPNAPMMAIKSSVAPKQPVRTRPRKKTVVAADRARGWWFEIQPRTRWGIAACGGAALLLLLDVIVLVPTAKGTVKIEIDDPQATVVVDQEKISVERLGEPIELRTGEHELIVRRGDVVVETRDFTIVKGEKTVVRIRLLDLIAPFNETVAKQKQQQWADCLGTSVVETNTIGMKLALIPAGEFLMGSPESEEHRSSNETQHRVQITNPFYLGTTEVTQGQWESVMGTTPWRGVSSVKEGNDYPATYVSWEDAVEFCRRLSAKEGKTYRLPTEAEWEYACRAGSTTAYSFGDSAASLKDYAWFLDNASNVGEPYAHRVGQKRANAFGLYDTHGNVGEWCQDWYDVNFYATVAAKQPNPVNASGGSSRVLRGGAFRDGAWLSRAANRDGDVLVYRYFNDGFRLARTP